MGQISKSLSLQCVSLLVGSVGRWRFKTQLQLWRWKRIKFCGRYLCFSFIQLNDSSFQRASAWATSRENNVNADCWLPRRKVDAAAAKQMKLTPSSPKKNFQSRQIKRLARLEVQPPCFLLICTQTPAHWHPKLPIKWYGSIYFVSLGEKSAVPFTQ